MKSGESPQTGPSQRSGIERYNGTTYNVLDLTKQVAELEMP